MISFDKLSLKNVLVHKDTEFSFENGITVVRGDNGSGKSLMFGSLANIFDGSLPTMKKKDAKSALGNVNSSIAIKYSYNNIPYEITQFRKKSASLSYQIVKDGESIDPHTISVAKEYIDSIFPISNSQYFSLVHLIPYRGDILRTGNGSQRKDFFEDLFRLNSSEIVEVELKARLNELKRGAEEVSILSQQLEELTYVDNIEQLETNFKETNDELTRYSTDYNKITSSLQHLVAIDTLKQQIKTEYSLEALREYKQKYESSIKGIKKSISDLKLSIIRYKENISKIAEKKQLVEKRQSLGEDLSATELNSMLSTQTQELSTLEDKLREASTNNGLLAQAESLLKTIPSGFLKLESYDKVIEFFAKKESEILTEDKLKSKVKGLVGISRCPTCNSVINEADVESLLNKCNEKIEKIQGYLNHKPTVTKYFKLKEKDLQYTDETDLRDKIEEARASQTEITSRISKARERERLENRIAGFSNITEDMEEPNEELVDQYEQKLATNEKKLKVIESDISLKEQLNTLTANDTEDSQTDTDDLKSSLNKLSPIIASLNDKKMELNNKISIGKLQNTNYLKLQKRIEMLNTKLIDLPVYEALVKAYGAKGLRIEQIKYLADCFCENLNKYASLLFVKPVTFSVNVDSTNFNIFYEMNNNPISDVCTLSGAESRSFMLLCLVSLLPFIPERVRTDTVILDEVESGMSEDTRLYINQGFYKLLLNIVPKIVIITPLNAKEYFVDSDREYYLRLVDKRTVVERIK